MKVATRLALCMGLFATGCLNWPGPTADVGNYRGPEAARAQEPQGERAPPPRVTPDQVNDQNAMEIVDMLKRELDADEQRSSQSLGDPTE